MPRPVSFVTPPNRVPFWKKLWGAPRALNQSETEEAFEEFQNAFVPSHMHKAFLKTFGAPKAKFNNRFFTDEAAFQLWSTRLDQLSLGSEGKAEVTVIYGSPDHLEAHLLKGELRRTLKDIVVDDWQPACAIVRTTRTTLYLFVEPKMRGCVVRSVRSEGEPADETEPVD